ncbi:MAG: PSD1 and planctomycete cytochrome C domain-containing protein [Planctomycetota bacterium]|nr:PSD1 and planctomycete cytochrome C domain-containing protein [Planctomycetota bacterium]
MILMLWMIVGAHADPPVLIRPADDAHQTSLGNPVDYLNDIKPILVRRCYTCHGPDPSTRSGSFRLDERGSAIRMRDGYQVIRPGKADESELIARILSTDPADQMPPHGPRLTEEETDLIRRWIDQGSPYEEHWSFKAIRDVAAPGLKALARHKVRDPLDQFILAALENAGIHCSEDASPAQQLRRLSSDLTGLPPSEEEVLSYEADPTDERWSEMVERYLADPAFGERWGRHWLDLVRYAETCGHEFDYPIDDAWRYRDYVIKALNTDLPYDRFVREHIAGDLTTPRFDEESGVDQSVLATGFWHLHQAVHGPVDVRQDELERLDNQIDVLTKTFMGLTVSCARCHDHKFDPITQKDYYGLSGILRSSRRTRAYLDPDGALETTRVQVREMLEQMNSELEVTGARADQLLPMKDLMTPLKNALTNSADSDVVRSERIFAGFDSDEFDGWETEGNAFARGPQSIDTVREPFRPQFGSTAGMVNTCDDRPGGTGDADTGSLLSRPFMIDHAEIVFRMSGGRDPQRTCVQLLVDDEVVYSAHGRDDVVMREIRWDVRPFQGGSGRIRILDTDTGAWGHVVVDDIRFRQIPGYGGGLTQSIAELARRTELSPNSAVQWLSALNDEEIGDHAHPLNRWAINSKIPPSGPVPSAQYPDRTGTYWQDSGHAWPRARGQRLESGRLGGQFQGTLRSQAFTLEHDWVLVRARGQGTVRLFVDGFMMNQFNPLLFEGMIQRINGPWRVVKIPVDAYLGERGWIELIDDSDGALEIDWIAFDDSAEACLPVIVPAEPSWTDDAVQTWLARNRLVDQLPPSVEDHAQALMRRQVKLDELTSRVEPPMRALAMQDGNVLEERVLQRGSHRTPGSEAPRSLVESICGRLEIRSEGSGRQELAEQILDDGNPLTARVAVNRIWHHLLGRGIVETCDDFGALGAMPTHPELLDHLASDFSRDWSIKRMIRRIVSSSTYRRSSTPIDDRVVEIDPNNSLLARARIRRLDAEAIRDGTLFIAGRLDDRRHGPPVPIHLTSFMDGRGRPGTSGPVDGEGRRSIYLEVRRNFPSPLMAVFDRPIPSSTNGRRNQSNVPAQALAMMNDEFMHQMAEAWGLRAREHGRLERTWRQAFARAPTPEEIELCVAFLDAGDDDTESWTELCHALLNTKEYIYLH